VGLQRVYELILSKVFNPYIVDVLSHLSYVELGNGQKYDREYFDYKDGFSRHFEIQVNECIFWLKVESIMKIGLFTAPSIIHFKTAVESLKAILGRLGVNEVLFQISPNSPQYQFLQQIAVAHESWHLGHLTFDPDIVENLNDYQFNYCDQDTF
jgi:hypothetical protein